jgi:hypothetical protein
MRTASRTLLLLIALAVSVGLATPKRAVSVTCQLTDEECVRCGPPSGLRDCYYYTCSDGSMRVSCNRCGNCI